ncbi:mandelate racemase/muconate lactonizing enzyme family protein [Micropruina sonneratiae]|uniref:mandelate racemase/muconate lactonizing enzyme family protein n=1 Tax=Micropruina sonneratiae TaxID=2986940 RepID=UPI0022275EB4|nr:mandelate racemase/muconate lactonizing enzyme family protein [Micropruina sp. KQZ13P-5]MCW3158054.1 mandelate racemase/muconate lactonizing enzyme family protein [Micropruina sp. KQZ13P-5]
MRIEAVDIFYLAVPQLRDIGDGSQDMALVRVRAGGHTGWGECEASPLPTIAALVTPPSHSACHGVLDSVLGERLDDVADIGRLARRVAERGLDLLQTPHAWSGVEIALWDLLGRARGVAVWQLLGVAQPQPRRPYASQLFGDDPQQTHDKAVQVVAAGFTAAKFGWGPYGTGSVEADAEQVAAARAGLGDEVDLLVDAGTVWGEDIEAAAARLPALERAGVVWLEEPFVAGALAAHAELARRCRGVRLAGGEGAHNTHLARQLIDHGGVGFIQIDTGRMGGIGPAAAVAGYAAGRGVTFVNHTFTSHLALVASLLPYAGQPGGRLCEYPVESSPLARGLTRDHLEPGDDGLIRLPEGPGLGLDLDLDAVSPYLQEVEIVLNGQTLYRTPELVP